MRKHGVPWYISMERKMTMNQMRIQSENMILGFHPVTGLPLSLTNKTTGLEYLKKTSQPLFALVGYINGEKVKLTAADAVTAGVHPVDKGVSLYYNFLGEKAVCVRCDIAVTDAGDFRFGIAIDKACMEVMSVEYPLFVMKDELKGAQEDWILMMHPFENGMLIHGFENALTEMPKAFADAEDCNPAQFAACGCGSEQLYLATADCGHYAKQLIPCIYEDGLHMSAYYYPEDRNADRISIPYEITMSVLNDGEWYASAEKFRSWSDRQSWAQKPLTEREDVPDWWLNSPVVLAIKEQGKRNSEMAQKVSPWCHPLEKGIPRILEIAQKMDSPVNVQVFHWEKGGGFVNGDHFPPLSGFDGTKKFFDELHKNGHTGGAYIIPHKWTFKAHVTGFDPSPFLFDKMTVRNSVLERDGKPHFSRPWDWNWRKRIGVCVAEEEPRKELVNSFKAFTDMDADYIQFDTFCGVLPTCYNPRHKHPMGNGKWQIEETLSILKEIRSFDKDFVLTFEAQPIPDVIPMAHGFVERGLHPVNRKGVEMIPLYQFLYHRYVQGFSGENCGDFNTPDNFFYVNAITFVSGDLTMISLDMHGDVCMQTHELDAYNQTVNTVYPDEDIYEYLKRINHLRRNAARAYLSEGAMLRAPKIDCASAGVLCGDGFDISIPSVLGSSWQSADGKTATVLVNHTGEDQTVVADVRTRSAKGTMTDCFDNVCDVSINEGKIALVMKARTAVLIEY